MNDTPSQLERLDFWSEIIGQYLGTNIVDGFIHVRIGKKTLVFDSDSKETSILRGQLKKVLVNQTVGILRTDLSEAPLIVRIINEE